MGMITEYPGRYYTPPIHFTVNLEPYIDHVILANPDHPDYIDAFIRQLRREWKRKPLKWWQKPFK